MEVRLAVSSSTFPFSSAVSPPHSVGGLSVSKQAVAWRLLPRQSGRPVARSSRLLMLMWLFSDSSSACLNICFLCRDDFSGHDSAEKRGLVGGVRVRHSNTETRTAELVLHIRCLDEDAGTGAAVFPLDAKPLPKAALRSSSFLGGSRLHDAVGG